MELNILRIQGQLHVNERVWKTPVEHSYLIRKERPRGVLESYLLQRVCLPRLALEVEKIQRVAIDILALARVSFVC